MAVTALWTSPSFLASEAAAQFCGISVDCDWSVPDVAHYTFDDLVTGGNAVNSVAGGPEAIWRGSDTQTPVAGIIGTASQSNDENGGSNEHYQILDLPALEGAGGLTLSIWFNQNLEVNNNNVRSGLLGSRAIESSWGGGSLWGMQLATNASVKGVDNRIANDNAGGNIQPGELLPDGTTTWDGIPTEDAWHHMAVTWDGTTGEHKTFYDGQVIDLNTNATNIGTILNSTTPVGGDLKPGWFIGEDTCCGNREFTGTLDDVGMWSTTLSETDISQIYQAGLIGVNLSKVEPPQPGDVDLDGDVDLTDFGFIEGNFFTEAGADRADGDLTGGGAVEWADFREWKDNFPFPAAGSGAGATPEPAAGLLLALSALSFGMRRRQS